MCFGGCADPPEDITETHWGTAYSRGQAVSRTGKYTSISMYGESVYWLEEIYLKSNWSGESIGMSGFFLRCVWSGG